MAMAIKKNYTFTSIQLVKFRPGTKMYIILMNYLMFNVWMSKYLVTYCRLHSHRLMWVSMYKWREYSSVFIWRTYRTPSVSVVQCCHCSFLRCRSLEYRIHVTDTWRILWVYVNAVCSMWHLQIIIIISSSTEFYTYLYRPWLNVIYVQSLPGAYNFQWA